MTSGYLILEDGTVFRGRSVAADGVAFGEAVFTTGMTGYQETVTDPSYAEQLVAFTAAMVGNYGVDDSRLESERPHARAVLMRRLGGRAWADWLAGHGLVALDLDAEWTVTEDCFRSLSANSWLLGETLRGRVVKTVADGRLVFEA